MVKIKILYNAPLKRNLAGKFNKMNLNVKRHVKMAEFNRKFCHTSCKARIWRVMWSVIWNIIVYGCSIIVKSLPALDPHSLITFLYQEMTITDLSDLIYTIGKAASEHGTLELSNHQIW